MSRGANTEDLIYRTYTFYICRQEDPEGRTSKVAALRC